MTIAQITEKMIDYSEGNLHDICHFLKVWGYARTIGQLEGLDPITLQTLEAAALLHDIACPLCRIKYGSTNGKYQELEGKTLAAEFLKDCGLPEAMNERIVYLVSHHHTLTNVDGIDYRILLEADYLVNADEGHYSEENIRSALDTVFETVSGKALLKSIYRL